VRDATPWRSGTLAVIALLALALAGPARAGAQTPPPWTISVRGEAVSENDIAQVLMLELGAAALKPVVKDRAQMPALAPYAFFAGRGKDGKPVVWASGARAGDKRAPDALHAEARREMLAAGVLAALDGGLGGATWQRLYATVRDDANARTDLGLKIVDAVGAASDWTVAKSAADRRWVFANVPAGMARRDVYALLDTRAVRTTKPASGEAYVDLPGAFQVGCSFSNRITITFDATDRVKKLDLEPPKPNCL
jgi:hypothetical protein